MREAQISDWIGDLIVFGPDVVAKACGEWRRVQTKRPTIADIRKLCIEEQSSQRAHYAVVDARADPLAAEEAYARSVGFASALARRDAIEAREKAYRLAEEWRKTPEAQLDPAIAGTRSGGSKGAQSLGDIAKALGVMAREWTEEEMAEARRQIPGMTDG